MSEENDKNQSDEKVTVQRSRHRIYEPSPSQKGTNTKSKQLGTRPATESGSANTSSNTSQSLKRTQRSKTANPAKKKTRAITASPSNQKVAPSKSKSTKKSTAKEAAATSTKTAASSDANSAEAKIAPAKAKATTTKSRKKQASARKEKDLAGNSSSATNEAHAPSLSQKSLPPAASSAGTQQTTVTTPHTRTITASEADTSTHAGTHNFSQGSTTTSPTSKLDKTTLRVREEKARHIIKDYVIASMAIGTIPFPLIDLVAVTLIQRRMIHQLGGHYGFRADKDILKAWLAAITGSGSSLFSGHIFASVLKFTPLLGHAFGTLSFTITAGAATYAVGKIFIQHFEAGGTLLTFDPIAVRDHYSTYLKEGQEVAHELRKEGV